MQNQMTDQAQVLWRKISKTRPSVSEQADNVLISIALLGLVATVADGEPVSREVDKFLLSFRRKFALSSRQTLRLVSTALTILRRDEQGKAVEHACDTINEHLTCAQRCEMFEKLIDIVLVDGRLAHGEEVYLDYIAQRLGLIDSLQQRYP